MKIILISLITAILLAACASSRLADEPADLIAPGRSVSSLSQLGWEISAPVSASDAAKKDELLSDSPSSSDGQLWGSFAAKLAPGDELRPVSNNSGIGYAIFRDGALVDLYLITIF